MSNNKFTMEILLSVFEIPFIILAWIDYYLNLIFKTLAAGCILFAVLSIITMPITLLHNSVCGTIIMMKSTFSGENISFSDAIQVHQSRFPKL